MGSTNPAKRPNVTPMRTRKEMSWSMVPADTIRDFVNLCTEQGCAVVMGRTLNGSALSVCVLAGNDKARDYIGSMDDISPVLYSVAFAVGIEIPEGISF